MLVYEHNIVMSKVISILVLVYGLVYEHNLHYIMKIFIDNSQSWDKKM